MKKIHVTVLALVLLLFVSLVFAAPVNNNMQQSVTYGEVDVVNTPGGVVVAGEAVTYPVKSAAAPAKSAPAAHKAVHHTAQSTSAQRMQAQKADAAATRAANEASLKKGEPHLKVNTTTTDTEVYDVDVRNNRGNTNYGVVEKTVTKNGKSQTSGVVYSTYEPSKTARANEKTREISIAAGETLLYNKDISENRYGTNGLAADATMLWALNPYLSLGADYMMLHPRSKTHGNGADQRHYHGMYAHNIALAGKLTVNPWSTIQFYVPMGFGMMNARMRTDAAVSDSENKWGASMYAGLGMQYDITDALFAGLEYRYAYGWISDKNLTPYHKDKDLQFHTVMMRVGMRF